MLGPVHASDDGRELRLGGPKQRALLAMLLLRANQVVSRDQLIDGLWGERPPPSAGHTLDDYISRLLVGGRTTAHGVSRAVDQLAELVFRYVAALRSVGQQLQTDRDRLDLLAGSRGRRCDDSSAGDRQQLRWLQCAGHVSAHLTNRWRHQLELTLSLGRNINRRSRHATGPRQVHYQDNRHEVAPVPQRVRECKTTRRADDPNEG